MSTKTIIRRQKHSESRFFATARATAQDGNLSFEARGMLWYLLSKPDDWKVMVADLQREGGIGRDKVYRLLNELKKAGYIEREPVRDSAARVVAMEYIIHEEPLPEKPDTENTDTYKETEGNKAKKNISASPKFTKAEHSAAFNAIRDAYGYSNPGIIGKYKAFYFGMGRRSGEWATLAPPQSFTVEEFGRFATWAKEKMRASKGVATMPTALDTIARYTDEFRAARTAVPVSSEPLDLPERHPDMNHPKVLARQKELGRWLTAVEIDVLMGGL